MTARAAGPPLFCSTFIVSYARPAHSSHLAIIYAAGINLTTILIDIELLTSRRIVQLPTVPVSAALTIHEAY